jgi:hypothetical protein
MKPKKILIFIIMLFILISPLFAVKSIVALSSNNLVDGSSHNLLNSMLKQRLEAIGYKYYFADSMSDTNIQYYSAIDMINKNAETLVIDPVDKNSFDKIIEICEQNDIDVISLYSQFETQYDRIASITYDFDKSAQLIADDILENALVDNKDKEAVFMITLSNVDYNESIKKLINNLGENGTKVSDFFPINSDDQAVDYIPYINSKDSNNTILVFSNVKGAIIFHKYMMLQTGSDNFLKYCLSGYASEDTMKENKIRAILTLKTAEILDTIVDILETGELYDKQISQELKIYSDF